MIILAPLFLKGFFTGGSLIVAIGAQNAFVLKQGLKQRHLLLTALLCSIIDALLITLGILGFGRFVSSYPAALEVCRYFAIAYLLGYGFLSFKSAFYTSKTLSETSENPDSTKRKTVLILLALTLLNPHVYLDTVVLLGSISAQFDLSQQIYFALGAISASFLWFFSLSYGAGLLRPFFQKEIAWKIVDIAIGIVMWFIAFSLVGVSL